MMMPARTTLLAAALGLSAGLVSAEELKLADYQPSTHPYATGVYVPFAEEIAAATDGAVTVRAYMGGELGAGPAEQYNRVVDGVTDLAFGLPGYTAANFPKTLLTELPGVINAETGTARLIANLDALSSEYRRVVLIGLWNNAPNLLFMADTPVRSPSDLAGKKIRVPSRNAGLIIEAWGATPVSMPVSEIYNSMQTGIIDGAFIDGTATSVFRLSEVTDYITTGMDSVLSSFFLLMNRDSFRDLTEDQQAAVLAAGREASVRGNAVQLAGAEKGLAEFAALPDKEIIVLTPDEAEAFNAAAVPVVEKVLDEAEAKGLEARAFVAALQAD
ncbi:MAG: TRAP transporter substrate-binding protein [Qingshengfaniella sp.]